MIELDVWIAKFVSSTPGQSHTQLFWSKSAADSCIRLNHPDCSCVDWDYYTVVYKSRELRVKLIKRTLRAASVVSDTLPLPVAELAIMALQGDPVAIDAIKDAIKV